MKSPHSNPASDLLAADFRPSRLLSSLLAGFVVGLMETVFAIGLSALIFSGDLSIHLGSGIGLALVGGALGSIVIALFTTIPGIVGSNHEVPAAFTAVIVASIASAVTQSGSPSQLLPTVLTTIILTTLVSGLCFYLVGRFRVGNVIRFLPYPVIGGFLAGTGWLLLMGGITFMAGTALDPAQLIEPATLVRWLPGLGLGLVLFGVSQKTETAFAMPAMLAACLLLNVIGIWISGATSAELQAQGWLLDTVQTEFSWRMLSPSLLTETNWPVLFDQLPNIITLVLVSTVSLLLNISSLELVANTETDLSDELRTAGLANLASGLVGGLVNYQMLSVSTLNHRVGSRTRIPGVVAGLLMLLVFVIGSDVLILLPKPVMGAVLILLGLTFLSDWLVRTWFTLPKIDYLIVLTILLTVVIIGFLQGIALGLLLAIIIFVINYSRTDIVRHQLSGEVYRSRVIRTRPEREALSKLGCHIQIFELQGFIFFGTADKLLDHIRNHTSSCTPDVAGFIVLDFARTFGLDSTAMLSFQKMAKVIEPSAETIVLTSLPPVAEQQFRAAGLLEKYGNIKLMADLDQGVEWCENQLLQSVNLPATLPSSIQNQLNALVADDTQVATLLHYLEPVDVAAGSVLIEQGSLADELYFIESGQLTAQLERDDKPSVRLETITHGHVVGELGFYLRQARAAAVVADENSMVYRLTRNQLTNMETTDPQAAALLHNVIVQLLAKRLSHTVTALDALHT